jgi:transposase, IS5 family
MRWRALTGNPCDGHTLARVVLAIKALLGNVLERIVADAGYRGHNAPPPHRFHVYTAGQMRSVTEAIKRDFKRRAAIEPVISHLKDDHRMGRCQLAHTEGDAANIVLAAAGYNFRRFVRWLRLWLLAFLAALTPAFPLKPA